MSSHLSLGLVKDFKRMHNSLIETFNYWKGLLTWESRLSAEIGRLGSQEAFQMWALKFSNKRKEAESFVTVTWVTVAKPHRDPTVSNHTVLSVSLFPFDSQCWEVTAIRKHDLRQLAAWWVVCVHVIQETSAKKTLMASFQLGSHRASFMALNEWCCKGSHPPIEDDGECRTAELFLSSINEGKWTWKEI